MKHSFIAISLIAITACSSGEKISDPLPEYPETGQAGDGRLQKIIEYIRIDEGLPASRE